jgi:hypothetical protein
MKRAMYFMLVLCMSRVASAGLEARIEVARDVTGATAEVARTRVVLPELTANGSSIAIFMNIFGSGTVYFDDTFLAELSN